MNVVRTTPNRPRLARAVAVLAAGAALVGACSGDDEPIPTTTIATTTTTTPQRDEDGVLRIGAYLPRTGEGAALGDPMLAAIDEAIETINQTGGVLDQDVELEVVDEATGTGPGELVANGVDAVVGPASSNVALLQLDELVQSNGLVTCSPSATALSLDDYPDNNYFFRTVPSDSLQMVAIQRTAQETGVSTIAVAYLDDPYGRGLADRLVEEIEARRPPALVAEVDFSGEKEDLSAEAELLLSDDPGAVVILGDADDGSRMLAAVGTALEGETEPPLVIVNDSIRNARQTIEALPGPVRRGLVVVAPVAEPTDGSGPEGFFASHAAHCVYLIALAASQAESDAPVRIRAVLNSVSTGGQACETFAECLERLQRGVLIDYDPPGNVIELANNGDPAVGRFEIVPFDSDGTEARDQRDIIDVS